MRPFRSLSTVLAAVVSAALVLSACGGTDDDATTTDDTATATDEAMDDEMDMDDDDHEEGDDHESFAFGEPADEADADRTVEVEALDTLAYDPATVEVAAGETVTFVVTNSGSAVHEFVIGDEATQEEHAREMEEMMESGTEMHDEANALALGPGETKSITWHFTESGTLEFACHQPGHYAGGMRGTIDVS